MRKSIAAVMAAAVTCALMAMTPASALGSVSSPTSGWFWGDPLPQGNALSQIRFNGVRGYAVGSGGTIVRTDDAGATWSGLRTGLTSALTDLSVPAPDTLVAGGGCVARRSTDGGATLSRLRFASSDTRCRSPLAALAFLSGDVGYLATEDGNVQLTGDGGQSFAGRTAIPGTSAAGGQAKPTSLVFVNATTGFATTDGGRLFQTGDAGVTWTQRASRGAPFNDLVFADATTAYAVGPGSAIFASTDGGTSWAPKPATGIAPGLALSGVSCSSAAVCVATTADGRALARTTDGWASASTSSPSTLPLPAAAFAGPARVVAVGQGGTTRVSDDGGATFAAIGGGLGVGLTRLRSPGGNLGYAAGINGRIAMTSDGGASWSLINANTPDEVVDVAFPTPAVGYEVDTAGLVKRTRNGGVSWSDLDTGSGHPRAILAPSADTVLLLERGILRSTNGETFDAVGSRLVRRTQFFDGDIAGGAVFAFGRGTVVMSTNGGRTWSLIRKPGPRLTLLDLDFVSSRIGWLLDTAGRLYRTTNRGRNWTEIVGLGNGGGVEVAFSSANSGWVSTRAFGPRGVVMRTTDGGRSFAPQLIDVHDVHDGPFGTGGGIVATGPNDALALTIPGERPAPTLFATHNGGQAGRPSTLALAASPRRLSRPGTVTIRGRLRPAEGGEQITVGRFDRKRGRWALKAARAASNGSFTTTWQIGGAASFVATWPGDDDRAGDGSTALTVPVGRR